MACKIYIIIYYLLDSFRFNIFLITHEIINFFT